MIKCLKRENDTDNAHKVRWEPSKIESSNNNSQKKEFNYDRILQAVENTVNQSHDYFFCKNKKIST